MQFDHTWLQINLYDKYSSSQTYFYTNAINQIVKQRRTSINIFYEDVEYLCDSEENLKRWYALKEFDNKMFTFKEYYFYHEDCPRIFMKGIQEAYSKWQDRKRDLVYKKLKLIYNESYSSKDDDSHPDDQKSQNVVAMSHFLLEISDYNPYSKKYYLRVEAKRQRENILRKEVQNKNKSRRYLQDLNHELSAMLNDMSQLSQISTLSQEYTPKKLEVYKHQKVSLGSLKKSEGSAQKSKNSSANSANNSLTNSNSLIKFNFKKNKQFADKLIDQKINKIPISKQLKEQNSARVSPKFSNHPSETQLLKSKSIFSVSSFGALNKKTDLKTMNVNQKQHLKIDYQTNKRKSTDKETNRKRYQSQKKNQYEKNIIIKTKSTSKLQPKKQIEKLRIREISIAKMPTKPDEFSDKKLTETEFRLRSHKSEFTSSNHKPTLFQIKNTKHDLIQRGKKILELKN